MITDKVTLSNDTYNRIIFNDPILLSFFLDQGWKIGKDRNLKGIRDKGHYYHRGSLSVKLYPNIDAGIPEGFIKGNKERKEGYKEKISAGKKAKKVHMYHDISGNTYWISENEIIPEGFIKGSTDKQREAVSKANKGKPTWNKGKKIIMSAEHRAKINTSQAREDVREKKSCSMKKTLAENPDIIIKAFDTKKKNNNCVTSKPEEYHYKKLCEKYTFENVKRQYHDSRYPFMCDFYVKKLDLFIELNLSWTHGCHLFDPKNPEDLKKLNEWKKKAAKSKYYQEAIKIWTIKDVLKHKTAEDNRLNYLSIYKYNIDVLEDIIKYDNR